MVGIDIRLDAMSRFLGALSIGKTGRAYIVAKTGEMIAGPDPTHILHDQDGKLAPAKVAEVGDANLTASWDHYRVEGAGTRVIDLQGERLISIATPLISNGEDWLLVISVPEAEFSGFVSVNSRRAALLSLVVAALAIGLAALLVRQGLRTDRADRAVAERSEAVRQQSNAFARLALEAGQFEPDGTPPKALIETLAEATGARRAGLWRLLAGGHVLRCEDSFEPASGGHTAGVELSRQEVPAFIAALVAGEEIDAPDARRDRRTSALHGSLMAPFGTSAVFAVPVMQAATRTRIVLGLLLLEDARRDPAARDIARACATLVALRAPAELPAAAIVPATAASPTEQPGDDHGLDTALGPAPKDLAVANYARASVMVLRLPELAMARAAAEDASGPPLAHRVACAARDIAALHAIPYVKMLGATVVAASGHAATSSAAATDAALRLADTAIALREVCANLFGSEDAAEFGIGLDAGLVLGGMLGATDDPAAANGGLFNLWGDAVRNADAMAASAPAGGIQASERAYALLRKSFLFRPRGLFTDPAWATPAATSWPAAYDAPPRIGRDRRSDPAAPLLHLTTGRPVLGRAVGRRAARHLAPHPAQNLPYRADPHRRRLPRHHRRHRSRHRAGPRVRGAILAPHRRAGRPDRPHPGRRPGAGNNPTPHRHHPARPRRHGRGGRNRHPVHRGRTGHPARRRVRSLPIRGAAPRLRLRLGGLHLGRGVRLADLGERLHHRQPGRRRQPIHLRLP